MAIVVMGWANDQVGHLSQPLELERAIVTALALGSVLMGALAAFLHDDLKRIVSYSLVGDIGVVLLAMAALDQETWGPARTWILAYVVVKTAFAAWAATVEATYGTRQIHNLTGWARRSPLLAGGLGVIALAAVGLPGLASFDARARLMELALDPPLSAFAALGALGSIAYFGRIFAAGFGRPTAEVAQALNLMPHWPGDRPTRLWPDLAVQLRGAWRVNRGPAAATAVLVLALLGLTVAAGGLGGPAAAAGLGPAAAGR